MPLQTDVAFDSTEVDAALGDLELRGKRLAPAFRELRKPLRADQRDHAKAQSGPDSSWPPRSPMTEKRRLAHNRAVRTTKAMKTIAIGKSKRRSTPKKILGRLPAAIVMTVGELFVRATSRVPWSGAHQKGGRVGHGARLPARPFLWLSDRVVNTATFVLSEYVVKGWKR